MPVIDLGSVMGPQGPQGATGAAGAQGVQGTAGPNQVTTNTSSNITGILGANGSKVIAVTMDDAPNASHASNLVSSAGVAGAVAGKATEQQVASIETSNTASKAYAVGECFCLNGLLYRATTAIAAGGTITPNTNCVATTATAKPSHVLLWTNSNTSTSYAGQTILNTSLSRFSAVMISYKGTAGDSANQCAVLPITGSSTVSYVVSMITLPASSSSSVGLSRVFGVSTSGISCQDANIKTLLSGARETDNTRIIPAQIFGII